MPRERLQLYCRYILNLELWESIVRKRKRYSMYSLFLVYFTLVYIYNSLTVYFLSMIGNFVKIHCLQSSQLISAIYWIVLSFSGTKVVGMIY